MAILDALEVPTVRLVGHDWGAAVGWQTCIKHADRIDRYAALAVGHPSAYAHGGIVQKLKAYYVLFFQIPGLSEKMVSAADWWLWRQMLRYDAEMPTWKGDLSRPGRLTAAINIYRANLGLILPKDWPKVTVPVMGVWGEGDVALAERQMIASGTTSRHRGVTSGSRGTHWLQLEAPDKTTRCCSTSCGHELEADGPSRRTRTRKWSTR